ncbi:MAG TPA: hypothetical protein VK168_06450 [Saprospiraceae bacterium]|nr:hypothetical protein [Saprospiraceae bacterium]
MIRLKFISSIIPLLIWVNGYSQKVTNPFETLQKKKEIVYGLDNRRTHIYQHHTVIYGLYSGISFGKKLRLKIGINGTPFEVGKFIDENGIVKKNRLLFASVGEEFDFYQYKKIGMTTYLQAGIGNNFYRQLNQNGTEVDKGKQRIIPIETGLNFSYDLMAYLKLKTGFGWRFVAPNNSRELSGYYVRPARSSHPNRIPASPRRAWVFFDPAPCP